MMALGALLAAMVLLAALTAGVVLLIVGLARRRVALWVSGLIVAVLSLLLIVAAVGLFVRMAYERSTAMRPPMPAAARPPTFANATGVTGSFEHTGWQATTTYDDAGNEVVRIRLGGLSGFDEVLAEHFAKAAWADVKDALALPEGYSYQDWRPDDYKDKRLHRRTHTHPLTGTTYESVVAYDPGARTALVVMREVTNTDDDATATTAPAFGVKKGDRVVDMQPAPEEE